MNELIKDLGLPDQCDPDHISASFFLRLLAPRFSELKGVVNIGIEGMMTIGAFYLGAVMGPDHWKRWIAFLCYAGLAGALFDWIMPRMYFCHADQNIAGTAINFLGPWSGTVPLQGDVPNNSSDTPAMDPSCKSALLFEGRRSRPVPSGITCSNVCCTHILYLSLAIWRPGLCFYKTKFGAHLRTVGEHRGMWKLLVLMFTKLRYTCVIPFWIPGEAWGAFVTLAPSTSSVRALSWDRASSPSQRFIFGKFSPEGATKACLLFGLCSGIKSPASQSNRGIP